MEATLRVMPAAAGWVRVSAADTHRDLGFLVYCLKSEGRVCGVSAVRENLVSHVHISSSCCEQSLCTTPGVFWASGNEAEH